MRRGGMRDETAALPVLEAILVAILVLGAILFVSNVKRPLSGAQEGGVDLGPLAAQALQLLRAHNFTDPNGRVLGPEAWVNETMRGNASAAALVDDYVGRILPIGARHLLLLTNGRGNLTLAPEVSPGPPRDARAAEEPFFPHWQAFANRTATDQASPGQALSAGHTVLLSFTTAGSTVHCLKAPDGQSVGPSGAAWLTAWRATNGRVPDGALYGVWAGYTDAGCTTGATYARVALRAGTATDYPIYGLRLVVWFGT